MQGAYLSQCASSRLIFMPVENFMMRCSGFFLIPFSALVSELIYGKEIFAWSNIR